ncbi:MAG: SUMF1/EgtB/PvdO family nonheme iron enzyme, partial [Planctomycetes bacterium]|nr:SUMF1/EgtB/PvdO family nonheme iron enzyme [Planctomycetota bacterium]
MFGHPIGPETRNRKASHPVVYVSLTDAQAYAQWVSDKTGWTIVIPTSDQWEKAARGPKGFLYPWGDTIDVTYRDGVLKSKLSFNGVTAAQFLKDDPKRVVTYNNRKSPYFGKRVHVALCFSDSLVVAGRLDNPIDATRPELGGDVGLAQPVGHQVEHGI